MNTLALEDAIHAHKEARRILASQLPAHGCVSKETGYKFDDNIMWVDGEVICSYRWVSNIKKD